MSDEQQPDLRWAPLPSAPKRRGRVWLIAGLVTAAFLIAAVLLFFLIPRGGTPVPTPSPTASMTPTTSPTPTVSPTPTPTVTPVPSPPVVDPDIEAFAAQVQPRLDDAVTGLGLLDGMNGQEAVQVVDQLQQDADRLAEAVAPGSISSAWYANVSDYAARLRELRAAYEAGTGTQGAADASETALESLRDLVGL